MSETVKTITHPDGTRRVELFRRADGTYGFEESVWAEDEQCWIPVGGYVMSITDSLESAEREARGRVRWLRDADAE